MRSEQVAEQRARAETALRWLLLALLCALVRWPHFGGPYSLDEGAYLAVAGEILAGELPLTSAWFNRSPLCFAIYAVPLVLPLDPDRALDLFGWVLATVAAWGVDSVLAAAVAPGWRWFGSIAYALASSDLSLQGQTANNELVLNALLAWALAALLDFAKSGRRSRLVGAALLFGLAFAVKELALFFVVVPLLVLIRRGAPSRGRNVTLFVAISSAPWAAIAATYLLAGAAESLGRLVQFHASYSAMSIAKLAAGPLLWTHMGYSAFGIWPLALLAVLGLGQLPWQTDFELSSRLYLLLAFATTVATGQYFAHYAYLALPPVVLVATSFLSRLGEAPAQRSGSNRRIAAVAMAIVASLQTLQAAGRIPLEVRQLAPVGPIDSEIRALGRKLAEAAPEGARLFVYGNAANLYLYSGLRPAAPDVWGYSAGVSALDESVRSWLARRTLAALAEKPPDLIVLREPLAEGAVEQRLARLLEEQYTRSAELERKVGTVALEVFRRDGPGASHLRAR